MAHRIEGHFLHPLLGPLRNLSASVPDRRIWEVYRVVSSELPEYSPTQALATLTAFRQTTPAVNLNTYDMKGFRESHPILELLPPDLVTAVITKVMRSLAQIKVKDVRSMAELDDAVINKHFTGPVSIAHINALRTLAQEEFRQRC